MTTLGKINEKKKITNSIYLMPSTNGKRKCRKLGVVNFSKIRKTCSWHVAVLQRTASKCAEISDQLFY